jgi:hypothetical protein
MPYRRMEPDWELRFLAALVPYRNVSHACREAGVGRRTVYQHRARRPEFKRLWDTILNPPATHRSDRHQKREYPEWYGRMQSAKGRLGAAKRWGGTLGERRRGHTVKTAR